MDAFSDLSSGQKFNSIRTAFQGFACVLDAENLKMTSPNSADSRCMASAI